MSTEVTDVVNNLSAHPISLYMHVSGTTLLLIDWISALDTEISHAWNGRWNLGRILYFITRYSAFLDIVVELYYKSAHSILPPTCARIDAIRGSTVMFGITVAELIMTIRVWALWGRSKDLGILLIIVSIIDVAASSAAYAHFGPPYQYVVMDSLSSIIPGCFPVVTDATTNSWAFIPLVVHQTFIFVLTVIKGLQHYWAGIYGISLVGTFYRDGITYYALLVAFSVVNLAAIIQRSDMADPYFLTFLQRILHSILSARMLLHLRRELNSSRDSKSLSSLKFASVGSLDGSSSVLTSQVPGEPNIRNDGWFGQEESPLQRAQCVGLPVEA